jgi:F0F1-type ATP synthase membrane subunit b/b'
MVNSSIIVVVTLLVAPALLYAAPEGGKAYGPAYTIPYWINFSVFVGIMYLILRKPFAAFWSSRCQEVQASLTTGTKELEQARESIDEIRALHATLESRKSEIRARIQSETQNEEKAILAQSKNAVDYILASAKQNSEAERVRAIQLLQTDIANEVVVRAEAELKKRIGPDEDRKLRSVASAGLSSFSQQGRN